MEQCQREMGGHARRGTTARRAAAVLAILSSAVLSLGGCGGGGTDAPAPPPSDPDAAVTGTLRTFTYSDTASDVILDPFRKQNPDLDLKTATFDSVQEGAAKLAGGFEADVVNVCSDEYQPLVARGLLRPIDPAGIEGWEKLAFRDNEGVQPRTGTSTSSRSRPARRASSTTPSRSTPPPDSWADLFDPAYARPCLDRRRHLADADRRDGARARDRRPDEAHATSRSSRRSST